MNEWTWTDFLSSPKQRRKSQIGKNRRYTHLEADLGFFPDDLIFEIYVFTACKRLRWIEDSLVAQILRSFPYAMEGTLTSFVTSFRHCFRKMIKEVPITPEGEENLNFPLKYFIVATIQIAMEKLKPKMANTCAQRVKLKSPVSATMNESDGIKWQ